MATATALPTKMDMVRQARAALGDNAKRDAIGAWIAAKYNGFVLEPDVISTYMGNLRKEARKLAGGTTPAKPHRIRKKAAKTQPTALAQPAQPGQQAQKTQAGLGFNESGVRDMATITDMLRRTRAPVLKGAIDVLDKALTRA